MKRKYQIIILIIIYLSSTGCLRTYFPLLYESSASPMVFETSNKDTLNSKYASLDLTISKGEYSNESAQILKGNYIISMTKNHININAKFFGYSGFYKVSGLEKYNGLKYAIGFGTDLSLNINFKIKDLRLGVGGNLGFSTEFGDYYGFRKTANKEGIIKSEMGFGFFTGSLFPIVAYQFSDNTILSTQVNVGVPGIFSPSVVLNNNDYIYWLSWVPNYGEEDNIGRRVVFGFMINLNKFNNAL